MVTSVISVETAALRTIAGKLHDAGATVERLDDASDDGAASAGSPLAARALAGFAESWQQACTATADGLRELGALVSGATTLYEDADSRVAGTLVTPEA